MLRWWSGPWPASLVLPRPALAPRLSTPARKQVSAPTRELTISSLEAYAEYSIQVSAVSMNGLASYHSTDALKASDGQLVRTLPTAPQQVGSLSASAGALGKSVTVIWEQPSSNGAPITNYSIVMVKDETEAPALADSEPTRCGAVGSVRTSWPSLALSASVEWYDARPFVDTADT